ncbi:hypothetical protein quinque_014817 [Culex quinquefasciatus]
MPSIHLTSSPGPYSASSHPISSRIRCGVQGQAVPRLVGGIEAVCKVKLRRAVSMMRTIRGHEHGKWIPVTTESARWRDPHPAGG